VGPLSWRVIFQLLSIPLQDDVRFFRIPLPALLSVSFTGYLPQGKKYGLTMFYLWDMEGLGPAFSPVILRLCIASLSRNNLITSHFGQELISIFSSLTVTTFISSSHLLTVPSEPSPQATWCWSLCRSSRFDFSFWWGTFCPSLSHRQVTSPAWMGRLLL